MSKFLLILFLGIGKIGLLFAEHDFTFVHPGALNNQVDLDFVKAKIKAREEPWNTTFLQVKKLAVPGNAALTYINSKNDIEANASKLAAQNAYANALLWYFTDQEIYATQAIQILNNWSLLQGFNGGDDQDKLQAGWIGALFGSAAELMSVYPKWETDDQRKLQEMFKRAFYPQLNTPSSWNGNVDLVQIEAMMALAVFNEDDAEIHLALDRFEQRVQAYFYLASDDKILSIEGDGNDTNRFWSHPVKWIDGLTQESCRDNGHHAQYALASAVHIMEIAWNQGFNTFTQYRTRFISAMELLAKQLLTGSMQGTCSNDVTNQVFFATWEIGYHHYHHRQNIDLPNTKQLIEKKIRKHGQSDWNIFYETLTHARLEEDKSGGDISKNKNTKPIYFLLIGLVSLLGFFFYYKKAN